MPLCSECGELPVKKHRNRFCSISCKMKWQQRTSEATKEASRKNRAAANTHPNSIRARRETMRRVATEWNEKRASYPELDQMVQDAATRGKRESSIFRDAARRTITETNKRPDVRAKKSAKAAERARNNPNFCGRSIPLTYKDRLERFHHMKSMTEVRYAMWLDGRGYSWGYEPCIVQWIDVNISRSYVPDFWVVELATFIEVKGYIREDSREYYKRIADSSGVTIQLLDSRTLDDLDAPTLGKIRPGQTVGWATHGAQRSPSRSYLQ